MCVCVCVCVCGWVGRESCECGCGKGVCICDDFYHTHTINSSPEGATKLKFAILLHCT